MLAGGRAMIIGVTAHLHRADHKGFVQVARGVCATAPGDAFPFERDIAAGDVRRGAHDAHFLLER
jgi:hypothetical protein